MHREVRWILSGSLIWALAACQPEESELSGSDTENVSTVTEQVPTSDGSPGSTPASPAVDVAADFLSAFFVQSFEAYEAEAERLRETDPRFLIQRNQWRFSETSPLLESYPLAAARFEYAHAAGLTGAGQTVSMIDSGFASSHEAFAQTDLSFPLGTPPLERHGTAVASVIAGRSDAMTGVAPGARLSISSFGGQDALADATREATRIRAVAQNNSWGYEIAPTRSNFDLVFTSQPGYLDALVEYARDGVVVFAASNDKSRTRSTLMEALPVLMPDLEAGWLSVVNAVPDFDERRIVSADLISSGCLETARWCLAADGTWMVAGTQSTTHYRLTTGTSFAAPQVSGALALLAEAFPDLTPHELRSRLLASADNGFFEHDAVLEIAPGFFHGYNDEFGHGFLDVRAALLPIGRTILPSEGGDDAEAGEPILMAGAAVGDAVTRALEDHDVLVTDSLGGDFRIGAGALVARALPQPLMTDRLASLGGGASDEPGRRAEADVLNALTGQRVRLSAPDGALEVSLVAPASGDAAVGLRRIGGTGRGRLGFGLSVFRNGSGSVGLTSLSEDGSGTWAATLDVEATARLSAMTDLSLFGQVGLMGAPDGNAYAEVSAAEFASLGVDLGRRDAFRRGDRVGLGLALPTAITSGSAAMRLPVTRENGAVSFAPVTVDLAPQEREMRLSLNYRAPLGNGWTVVAEGVHAVNRGHVAGATDTGALFGLEARF